MNFPGWIQSRLFDLEDRIAAISVFFPTKQASEGSNLTHDLIGYGGQWPEFSWPNGKRLAVSVVVNFEEGAERWVGG